VTSGGGTDWDVGETDGSVGIVDPVVTIAVEDSGWAGIGLSGGTVAVELVLVQALNNRRKTIKRILKDISLYSHHSFLHELSDKSSAIEMGYPLT
jgi:hypothetical protein